MSDIETAYDGDRIYITKGEHRGSSATVLGPGEPWCYRVELERGERVTMGMYDFDNLSRKRLDIPDRGV